VTVIALRPSRRSDTKLRLGYREQLAHDGATILQALPAVSGIRKGGNYGLDPVFRGFKYDQLNIVMNGVQSATAACPNRMDPPTSQMTPNMLERIELLKGPHALRFGSGLGATINFVPSPLRFTDEADRYGRFSTSYGENGQVWRNEGQLGLTGASYDFSLQGAWAQGADYRTGDDQPVAAGF
jgi:iron complex outermembrane receptor protein